MNRMHMMTKEVLFLLFLSLSATAYGQFGLRSGLNRHDVSTEEGRYTELGGDLAIHYWFRLKNLRLEFYPEVSYSFFNHNNFAFIRDFKYKWQRFGLSLPTRLLPPGFYLGL